MRKDSPDDICWVTGKLPPEDCPPTNSPPPHWIMVRNGGNLPGGNFPSTHI